MEKWPFLKQNHGLIPLEKFEFFDFLNFCFYRLARRYFVIEYRETYFPGLFCLQKKVGKIAIFEPKPWVNPFEKIGILGLFEGLFYIA